MIGSSVLELPASSGPDLFEPLGCSGQDSIFICTNNYNPPASQIGNAITGVVVGVVVGVVMATPFTPLPIPIGEELES